MRYLINYFHLRAAQISYLMEIYVLFTAYKLHYLRTSPVSHITLMLCNLHEKLI
jgi:hypothetical protein